MKIAKCFIVIVLLMGMTQVLGQDNPCTPEDYVPSLSVCDPTGYRKKIFVLPSAVTCAGPTQLPMTLTVSCDCELSEYIPRSVTCDPITNARTVSQYYAPSGCVMNKETLLSLQTLAVNASKSSLPCDCTTDHIGYEYTRCNTTSKDFSMVAFWNNQCHDTGKIHLPQATTIGCNVECASGKFLGPPATKCQNCSSGTWSFQGENYHPPWNTFPADWHIYCDGDNCQNWRAFEYYIESGDQKGANNVISGLKFFVEVRTAPSIMRIRYRVSSETNADGFIIFANDIRQFSISGDSGEWAVAEVDLQEANAQCKWEVNILSPDKLAGTTVCIDRSEITPYHTSKHFQATNSPYLSPLVTPVVGDTGCSVTDFNAALTKGKIAIVLRGDCPFVTKIRNAQAAGAIAILVVDNVNEAHLYMGGDANDIAIPSGSLSLNKGRPIYVAARNGLHVNANISRVNIHTGRTEIELMYYKDGDTSVGSDRVYIRSIEITGTRLASRTCHPCEPGFTSLPGSSQCRPCPANHYSDVWGSPSPCKICPERHISAPGATLCELDEMCTVEDYTPEFSHCTKKGDDYIKTVQYVAIKPQTCDLNHSTYTPPANIVVPCGDCALGAFRNATHNCEMCPPGTIPSAAGCQSCPEGTYAEQNLLYNDFNSMEGVLPRSWRARCFLCFGRRGWDLMPTNPDDQFMTSQLVTGRGLEEHAYTNLHKNITLNSDGFITFTYSLVFTNLTTLEDNVHVEFRVTELSGIDTGEVVVSKALVVNGAKSSQEARFTQNLDKGRYMIQWTYTKLKMTYEPILFVISTLQIMGDNEGGANTCTPCPAGHYCVKPAYVATPCEPGSYSGEKATSCTPCPMGMIQREPRGDVCYQCMYPFEPDPTRTICVLPDCTVTTARDGRLYTYDLSTLGAMGPIAPTGNHTSVQNEFGNAFDDLESGYFNLCGAVSGKGNVCQTRNKLTLPKTHACLASEKGISYDMGSYIGLDEMEWEDNSWGLQVSLAAGDWCPYDHNKRMSTFVDYICTPTTNETYVTFVTGATACEHVFEIRSQFACPLCTNDTYYKAVDQCLNGWRRTRYYYNTTTNQPDCYGGASMPQDEVTECPIIELEITKGNLAAVYGGVIGGAIFLISLIIGVVYLYMSKRALYNRYSALALPGEIQPGPHEMREVKMEDGP